LALARAQPDEADRLAQILIRYPQGDARGPILYRLAELAYERGDVAEAERYLHRAVASAPDGPPAAMGRALLARGLTGLDRWPQSFPGP
jgi:tetratricopeptide (TPR) repeat protein